MTVREWYSEAIIGKHYSLQLLIDFLVNEKKVLKMTDNESELTYYFQDKFHKKMNGHLAEYERSKRNDLNR